MPKLHEIEQYYTYSMIMDCIEMLDVKSALEEEERLRIQQETKRQ